VSDQNPNDFPVFFLASNKFCLSLTVNVECTLRGAGSCVFLPAFEFGFLATCDLPGAPEAFEFGFLATCDLGAFEFEFGFLATCDLGAFEFEFEFEFGFLATCDFATCDLPGAPEAFEFGFLATCDEGLFASDVPGCGFLNGSMNLLHSPYSG